MRTSMRIFATGASCLALAACAQGTNSGDGDDDSPIDARRIDAAGDETDAPIVDGPPVDGPIIDGSVIDGSVIDAPVIDAPPTDGPVIDAPPTDAPPTDGPPIDAPCMPTTMQLLVNPSFDQNPVGTGWVESPIDAMYPLITGDDGVPEHTAPYKVWLGGLVAPDLGTVTDNVYQQVQVPAGTTMLAVRGQYDVRTAEAPSTTVYDAAAIELTNSSGGVLEVIHTMGNPTPTTAWTTFQRTFTNPYAGQFVWLRFRSINDFVDPTSFYFDTVVLEATVACP